MIELSRHIESLMLKHDCVIVPGLGGFVTQYVPARCIAEEQLFLPPYRSVGFNPQLTLNDGLLVQSYMQAYDTSFPETIKLIDDAVRQLKYKLQTEGEYELSGIGRLTLGIDGHYDFIPCEAGVLSPELYGLDSFSVNMAHGNSTNTPSEKKNLQKRKPLIKRTDKDYTISISRELVNYAAAAIVAVFFYFLWATPVNNSPVVEKQAASIINEQLFCAQEPAEPAAAKMQQSHPIASTEKISQEKSDVAAKPQVEQKQPVQEQGRFTIVLASALPEANAKSLTETYKNEGLQAAETFKRKQMVRVIYGRYTTREDAQKTLSKMRSEKQPYFEQAWVLDLK